MTRQQSGRFAIVPARGIVEALGGKWRGTSGTCRCPAHDDRTPSLDVTERDGKILVKCRANCSQDAVLEALSNRGLWPEPRGKARKAGVPRAGAGDWTPILPVPAETPAPDFEALLAGAPSSFWDYQDSRGNLLGYTARVERGGKKSIIPVAWCRGPNGANAWRCKGFPEPRPLYGLSALAARPEAEVLIVEGEKVAVDAARLFEDHVAVTWPGGTGAVGKADWRRLKGRAVVVWPDADEPGAKAAREVADQAIRVGATSVRIVALPDGLPAGWDLADDLPSGVDVAKLVADAPDTRAAQLARLGIVTAAELAEREFREPKWAVPDMLPVGAAFLAGKPKTGKSWLALDFAVAAASGGPALGKFQCDQGEVLHLALEDTERRLQGRLRAVLQGAVAPRNLHIVTKWRRADQGGIDDLRLWLQTHPEAVLVVIDTFARVRGQANRAEGAYQNDYAAITPLKTLADEFEITLLLVHHQRKEKAEDPLESISGTGGLTGAVDTVLVLKREPGSPFGRLYIRGRDVPEHEMALQFESATGKWLTLGPAEDFRKSQERKELVRALIDVDGPMSPVELAKELGKTRTAVQRMLGKMAKSGEVVALGNGEYMAPER